jgi:hypothetical protein
MRLINDMPELSCDRKHANEIWDRYQAYAARYNGVNYALPTVNPFNDWDIEQRYAHRKDFDRARISRHRQGAKIVRQFLAKARKDGLL